jgi:predicted  nucleic acid-binding Zn-ribbon protein
LEITVLKKLLYPLAFGLASAFSSQASAQGVNNVGGSGQVQMMSIEGLDLESSLMAVQTNRVNLLDKQLREEMVNFKAKNANIAALNTQLEALKLAKDQTTDPKKIAKLDIQINELRAQIDALGNAQQMDMLRMQSLQNKRNEAFEIMTNFMKKMTDSRSGIIGNTR